MKKTGLVKVLFLCAPRHMWLYKTEMHTGHIYQKYWAKVWHCFVTIMNTDPPHRSCLYHAHNHHPEKKNHLLVVLCFFVLCWARAVKSRVCRLCARVFDTEGGETWQIRLKVSTLPPRRISLLSLAVAFKRNVFWLFVHRWNTKVVLFQSDMLEYALWRTLFITLCFFFFI